MKLSIIYLYILAPTLLLIKNGEKGRSRKLYLILQSLIAVSGAELLVARPAVAQSFRIQPSLELSTGDAFGSGGVYRDRHLDGGARLGW